MYKAFLTNSHAPSHAPEGELRTLRFQDGEAARDRPLPDPGRAVSFCKPVAIKHRGPAGVAGTPGGALASVTEDPERDT